MADKLSYCQACLSNERDLYPLMQLQDLLQQFHFCEMNSDGGICWECKSVIMKFHKFKAQVGYAQQLLRHCDKLQDLKCFSNLSININSNDYEFKYKNDPLTNTDSEQNIVIKQEIDTENTCSDITEYFKEIDEKDDLLDDIDCEEKPVIDSDIYVEILNSSLKEERKRLKKVRTKVKPKKYKTKLKTDIDEEEIKQKFTMVVFTEEEMIRNREEKRNQPNFKKIPFKCDSCVLGFTRKDTYNLHMEKKHDETIGNHQCAVCLIRFPAAKQVERHSRKHYVCYRCRLCKYETVELWSALSHCRLKHDRDTCERIHCQECGAVAKTPEEMSQHMGTEHSIICNECGEKFKGHNTLRLHKRAAENMNNEDLGSSSSYKKNLRNQLFEQQETSERESNIDTSEQKKRSKRKSNINDESGLHEDSHENSYLDYLVKQQQNSFITPSFVKHKRKKHKIELNENLDSTNNESEFSSAKKSIKREIDKINESINESENKTFPDHLTNEPIVDIRVSDSNETLTIEDKSAEQSVTETHNTSKRKVLIKSNEIDNEGDDEFIITQEIDVKTQKAVELKNLSELNIIENGQSKDSKPSKLEPIVTHSSKEAGDINIKTVHVRQSLNSPRQDGTSDNQEITDSPISSRSRGALKVSRRILFDDDTMEIDGDIIDSSDNIAEMDSDIVDTDNSAEMGSDIVGSCDNSAEINSDIEDSSDHDHPRPQCKLSEDSFITADDEVWVLKVPREFDITHLKGTDIVLDKDSGAKMKVYGQTYKGRVDDSIDRIALLTSQHGKFELKSVPIVGTVQFHQKIHNMDDNFIQNNPTNSLPEYKNSLFGHDNMKARNIPAEVIKTPIGNKKKNHSVPWSSRSRCPSRCGLHHAILRKITRTQKKRMRGRGK